MLISINQPAYIPWLGYFDRIHRSSVHVVLDHVQFEKNSMTNRNKIKTRDGWCWLTVPVRTKGSFGGLPISGVEITSQSNWQKKHFNSLCASYGKAPFFSENIDFFEYLLLKNKWTSLNALVREVTNHVLVQLNINTRVMYSSEMDLRLTKGDLVLEICEKLGASSYLSGPFGRDYLDLPAFAAREVDVMFHDYEHPVYEQLNGDFVSHLSIVDLLFNQGGRSLAILSSET